MAKLINYIVNKIIGDGQRPSICQMEKRLSFLTPRKDGKELLKYYYKKKIKNIFILSIGILVLLFFLFVNQAINPNIKEGNLLKRNENGKGDWEVNIEAEIQNEDYPVKVEIKEQCLTIDETNNQMNKLINELPMLIKGENTSIGHVVKDLNLQSSYSGYPFTIRWSSSDFNTLQDNGKLGDIPLHNQGENINLHAVISYEEIEKETDIRVTVYPLDLTEKEEKSSKLQELIQSTQNATKTESYLKLPEYINNSKIQWKEKKEGVAFILILLAATAILGIWIGSDNDLSRQCKKRERYLSLEYSEFVSKLQLLIGSGMTIRGAVERMGADYKKNRGEGGKKKYVYEELLLCIRKMQDGVSETESYDYFGKRCKLLCYKKLSSLLIQNIRKGTSGLTYALSNETKLAFEERKQQARRMGEEAQTKLLFPMILMLMIVMVIILIPAYLSFGGL